MIPAESLSPNQSDAGGRAGGGGGGQQSTPALARARISARKSEIRLCAVAKSFALAASEAAALVSSSDPACCLVRVPSRWSPVTPSLRALNDAAWIFTFTGVAASVCPALRATKKPGIGSSPAQH